jgi:hypothetical protein
MKINLLQDSAVWKRERWLGQDLAVLIPFRKIERGIATI